MFNINNQKINYFIFFKKNICFFLVFFLSFSYFFSIPGNIKAFSSTDSIIVKMVPEKPGPNKEVQVSLNSFTFNLNSAETSVLLNKKLLKKEVGLKTFSFKTGTAGTVTNLIIESKKLNGEIVTKVINIKPASVDLVYEVLNPHKPFTYKGKSTAISNSEIMIFAFPEFINERGQEYDKKTLVYNWSIDYNKDIKASGFGKDTYLIKRLNAFPRETVVSLEVSTLNKDIIAKDRIILKPKNTELEFYLLDPALPFSFKNIANPTIVSKYLDSSILVVPYFIDLKDEDTKFSWFINNKIQKNYDLGDDWNKITLLNSKDKFTNNILLSFKVSKKNRFLQSVSKNVKVLFEKEKNNSDIQFYRKGSVEVDTSNLFGL